MRLGVLVSSGGRTVLNLQEQIECGSLAASISVVICSRSDAPAVERCARAGLAVEVIDRRRTPEDEFHRAIANRLRAAEVDLVCMAGLLCFWRIPDDLLGRVINIHPALLPAFGGRGYYGDRVHQAVLGAGSTESGCTVHFADNLYDHGPTIVQRRVPVLPGDTAATLAARVFAEERIAYPEAIRRIIDGRESFPNESVRWGQAR
jgi:formyltetrahydrofolate-dependent phosphoribosylglycinamide formyltransferase